ncbi:hypothetical protein WG66_009622 [Moniliophthora roreri]|nr:hypothetical protein WG66_009622 [Moniliophthora roreri]
MAASEKLHRDILILVGHDKQHHCDTEISWREKVYATTQIPTASASATTIVPVNLPSAGQTRSGIDIDGQMLNVQDTTAV